MPELTIDLTISIGLHSQFIDIPRGNQKLTISLSPGRSEFTSAPIALGTLLGWESRPLLAVLAFIYELDERQRTITVCRGDVVSPETLTITTFPEGSDEGITQGPLGVPHQVAGLTAHPHWNYPTPLTRGVQDLVSELASAASDAVIRALVTLPGWTVRVRTPVPELPAELYSSLLMREDASGVRPAEPVAEAVRPGETAWSLESTFGGEVYFNPGENFANVIGSTHDPKIGGLTWIQVWSRQFGDYPNICTSHSYNGFRCGSSLVGGHVITGQVAAPVPRGSNSVYILPICVQHNNDDRTYMAALQYQKGIWLNNYLNAQVAA